MDEFRILSATAILGYGFPLSSFEEGMKRKPHLIAADAGSTDPGPYYLGVGQSFTDRSAVKRDLEIMIKAGLREKIPVVIGSAGGSGAEPHLRWCREIVDEIARENDLHFKLALIHAELDKDMIKRELAAGKVTPLGAKELTSEAVDATTHIVAQMGNEPFIRAFAENPDVILAGRAYDPSVFAALPIMRGYDAGLSIHLGKILECAAICATPGSGSDCMFGYIGDGYFRVEPLNPIRRCTTVSVSAHTLYEKTNPYILPGPGGHLDLTGCKFEQETDNIVRVTGTKFIPAESFTVKLEGARLIGYRTVSIAGVRDPIMIREIDNVTAGVRERVADNYSGWEYNLGFRIYGRDGVMGDMEPLRWAVPADNARSRASCAGVGLDEDSTSASRAVRDDRAVPHELGIVIEATADTQEMADAVCALARSTMLHYGYSGRKSTAGNLAFPYSPSDFHAGEVYAFSIYHLLHTDDDGSLFPYETILL